jgi:excisionase family DNA binding protein
MINAELLPAVVLQRKAVVYVRQSTQAQVQMNLESQRRQYDLVGEARRLGFRDIEVIDDDLGRSATGTVARPGFEKLVAWLCAGEVGAVLCLDASRLARNGRDWHHLLELCGLVEARVIDPDGVYDPCRANDRLLLGMKGSISEFEISVLRSRMFEAVRAKARRGELRISVPIGYVWHRELGLDFDPDQRLQEVVRLIFARFREIGSARQVFLALRSAQIHFPRPSDGRTLVSFDWTLIRYRNVISVLKNPFYAGVYVYGKSEKRTVIQDGRAHRSYGHGKPFDDWEVFIKDHHKGYIEWEEFERNQKQIAANAYSKAGDVKSGRGGAALLSGFLACARCGRRLSIAYRGRAPRQTVYRCNSMDLTGAARCMTFGGSRVDAAIAKELLRAVQPMAIEAAMEAERMHMQTLIEQQRVVKLELEQARYEATLAERRYAACDPDNRLIAAQLEKNWESALRRVEACQSRLDAMCASAQEIIAAPDFSGLAEDLEATWNAPGVTMRARQQLVRALITDIIADVDEEAREIILTIHWQGGQHSQLRLRKPKSGEHGRRASDEALAVVRSMSCRWSDQDIAASLNRMGMRTGQGMTWNAQRVSVLRREHGIRSYRSADKNGEWLTMSEAAELLGVSHHVIRRLIRERILCAEQVVPGAPHQIRASDLRNEQVAAAIARKHRPCRLNVDGQFPMFISTSEGGAQ